MSLYVHGQYFVATGRSLTGRSMGTHIFWSLSLHSKFKSAVRLYRQLTCNDVQLDGVRRVELLLSVLMTGGALSLRDACSAGNSLFRSKSLVRLYVDIVHLGQVRVF